MNKVASEQIVTADGHPIIARFFAPTSKIRGAAVIAPAMGTPQSYYEEFAEWLAANGFLAVTFDYRGTGLSRSGKLRGFEANLFDWARLDCGAILDELSSRAPDLPLYWIGHSLGGQILPFVPNRERIRKVVTVATGSGYWRENTPRLKRRVLWLWYFLVPVSMSLFGYFPGRRLRKVGDLPKGVMAQWRRWCLHREYVVGVERDAREQYAAVRTPIVSLSFTDDELMSARNIESIHGFFVNAPRTMKRIAPRDIGVRRIGHFGFFRRDNEQSLWHAHLLPELVAAK